MCDDVESRVGTVASSDGRGVVPAVQAASTSSVAETYPMPVADVCRCQTGSCRLCPRAQSRGQMRPTAAQMTSEMPGHQSRAQKRRRNGLPWARASIVGTAIVVDEVADEGDGGDHTGDGLGRKPRTIKVTSSATPRENNTIPSAVTRFSRAGCALVTQ